MARRGRSTIGESPLDAVVPQRAAKPTRSGKQAASTAPSPAAKRPAERSTKRTGSAKRRTPVAEPVREEPRTGGKKERLTVHVPQDLVDRVKNAVYWTPGLTLARMAEEALLAEVERREKGRGEPFPVRAEELRGGRPMK